MTEEHDESPESREAEQERSAVRVYIVDDHALFRAGVRAELGTADDRVRVIGEAGSVAEAVAGIEHLRPEVVLLDVHMPDGGGVEVLRRVRERCPEVVFLALSVSDAAEDVITTIRGGARGYVTKTISGRELADSICRVSDGDAVFSPRLAGFVLDAFAEGPNSAPVGDPELDQLTRREREVLRLLARGYAYREIGSELFISVKTVETHVSSVLRKTQLSNRYELSKWASDRRLI
ncbi:MULTISPECIES: response regulator [Actinopolyspora]|uniref:DNA-binding response regulator, NarL/FixJ family, contains REC and HTH domains n=1 Tax=Actinopolyspora saharensis TaxID=995062 RepID=A0A1H1GQ37_9ACTN|nr:MULTISPECIES: response regulator transcription factor [Actinopolyspora]NHD16704.1 response regulator transcription factor [Actinopolyspora sp. BKK2]NHE75433.1 response regulator transcription factor [Actinopolyspora sp. BKK1]SDR15193.1 DNA-binding response regulator, NarL/FixJ family, contains REC and HTH domains [Actinopolyspora saharensis]